MNDEAFTTLHRHWIWCEVIKDNFNKELHLNQSSLNKSMDLQKFFLASRYGTYMSVWYGLLYSVLETLKNNKVVIESIEKEISHIYTPLQDYRNAVFHPQPKYWSKKLFAIMKDKDSVAEIWKIHEVLSKYFRDEIDRRKPGITTYRYEII